MAYRSQADEDSADMCSLAPIKKKAGKNLFSAFKGLKVIPLSASSNSQTLPPAQQRENHQQRPSGLLNNSHLESGSPQIGTPRGAQGNNSPRGGEDIRDPHPCMQRRRYSDCTHEFGGPVLKENQSIKFMVECRTFQRRNLKPDNSSESAVYDSDKLINMDASQSRVLANRTEASNIKHSQHTPGSQFGKKQSQQAATAAKNIAVGHSKIIDSIYGFRKKNYTDKMGVLDLHSPYFESGNKRPTGQIGDARYGPGDRSAEAGSQHLHRSNAWMPLQSGRSLRETSNQKPQPSQHSTVKHGEFDPDTNEISQSGKKQRKGGKAVTSHPVHVNFLVEDKQTEPEGFYRSGQQKRAKTEVKKFNFRNPEDSHTEDKEESMKDQDQLGNTPPQAKNVDSSVDIEATPTSVMNVDRKIVRIDAVVDPSFKAPSDGHRDRNFQYSDGSEPSEDPKKEQQFDLAQIQEKMLVIESVDGREIQTPGFATLGKFNRKKSQGGSSSDHNSEEERDGSPNFSNNQDAPPKTFSLAQMTNSLNPSQFQRKRTQRMTHVTGNSQNTLQSSGAGVPGRLGVQRSQDRLKTFLVRGALSPSQAFQTYLKEEEKFSGQSELASKRRKSACIDPAEGSLNPLRLPSDGIAEGSKASADNLSHAGLGKLEIMPRVSFGGLHSGTSQTSSPAGSKESSIRKVPRFFIPEEMNQRSPISKKPSIKPFSKFHKASLPQITVSTADPQMTTSTGEGTAVCFSPRHGSSAEGSSEAKLVTLPVLEKENSIPTKEKKYIVRIRSKKNLFGARGSTGYLQSAREGTSARQQQATPYLCKLKLELPTKSSTKQSNKTART